MLSPEKILVLKQEKIDCYKKENNFIVSMAKKLEITFMIL